MPAGYKNANINRIAHSEGAVVLNENNALQHEYVLRDHLGNVRVTFRDGINLGNAYVDWSTWTYVDPNANNPSFNDGTITASDIKQINHYYPFGLNMEGNWNGAVGTNKYQYNEKELNDDFGLGWNDYGFRFYDAAVGRFWTIDPLAEADAHQTPYAYANNNPVSNIDVDGLASDKPVDGGNPISGRQIEVHATRIQKSDQGSKSLSGSEMNFLDKLQVGLSVAQFIPGLNTVVGLANAAIDVYRDNYGSAFINVLGAIPLAGVAIKAIAITAKIATVASKAKFVKGAALITGRIFKGGVYVLKDGEKVVRTGRTISLKLRRYQHSLDPVLKDFKFEKAYETNIYAEQRGLEHLLSVEHEATASALNGGYNKIRAIGKNNDKIDTYIEAAQNYLKNR